MDELRVEMPFDRLVEMATMLGSMETDLCPPLVEHECWLKRDLAGYLNVDPIENECIECWLRYILMGD